jgi:hypothetical protein
MTIRYPILFSYNTRTRATAPSLQVAVSILNTSYITAYILKIFAEMLHLMKCAIVPESQIDPYVIRSAFLSIDDYLKEVLTNHYFVQFICDYKTTEVPPVISLEVCAQAGLPLVDSQTYTNSTYILP